MRCVTKLNICGYSSCSQCIHCTLRSYFDYYKRQLFKRGYSTRGQQPPPLARRGLAGYLCIPARCGGPCRRRPDRTVTAHRRAQETPVGPSGFPCERPVGFASLWREMGSGTCAEGRASLNGTPVWFRCPRHSRGNGNLAPRECEFLSANLTVPPGLLRMSRRQE